MSSSNFAFDVQMSGYAFCVGDCSLLFSLTTICTEQSCSIQCGFYLRFRGDIACCRSLVTAPSLPHPLSPTTGATWCRFIETRLSLGFGKVEGSVFNRNIVTSSSSSVTLRSFCEIGHTTAPPGNWNWRHRDQLCTTDNTRCKLLIWDRNCIASARSEKRRIYELQVI